MATQMTPVSSSNISSVGYDADTQTLVVTFNSGRTYRYGGVPESEYTNMLNANSVGSYFANSIKNFFRVV